MLLDVLWLAIDSVILLVIHGDCGRVLTIRILKGSNSTPLRTRLVLMLLLYLLKDVICTPFFH